ncbi:hypothetical protein [Bifidobacterium biavatii]|uniref:Uncharacterized protein n=1 Tax=Bifidobacterium biavatii DSM 23969 TaxID=1437608 RepID=A0A086ZMI4_9BIFI|nr:hypothetical protein [Bifidobacterium biavatii]KFI47734.1 hypothetical protein BBIA_2426 [Bifidobacterium biavatii DSM 23969]
MTDATTEPTQRFPELAELDRMDDDQRIAAFRDVLDQLTHELDESR